MGSLAEYLRGQHDRTVAHLLAERERARSLSDVGYLRACTADLRRYGHREALETTQAAALPERAVPEPPRRGRRPLPRCEHDLIIGRCDACENKEIPDVED
jgi:hypothetical protein